MPKRKLPWSREPGLPPDPTRTTPHRRPPRARPAPEPEIETLCDECSAPGSGMESCETCGLTVCDDCRISLGHADGACGEDAS